MAGKMSGKGELVFNEEPYVYVLLQSNRGVRCDSCFEICESLKKCTACGILRYCNTKCQRSDWSLHKKECKCLQQFAPKIPLDSVRLMLRLIIKHWGVTTDTDINKEVPTSWKRNFSDLQSHVTEIQNDGQRREQFTQIVYTLQMLTQNVLDLPAPDQLFDIFGKMVINSFTICDGEMQSIGVGIYLSGSRLDHSCHPNAVITFSGRTLNLRTLEQIADVSPSNLRISYIDQLALTIERKKQLQEQYYFVCDCPRCTDKQFDGLMSCVKCQNLSCQDGYLLHSADGSYLPCSLCGWIMSDTSDSTFGTEVAKFQEDIFNELAEIKQLKDTKDSTKILEVCKNCLHQNHKYVHQYNVHILQIMDRAFDACIDIGDWEQALYYGCSTLIPYRQFYPPDSPNVGIQIMKVGKIQLYLGKLKDSLKNLQEAETILGITHGKDHILYKQLSELIHQCCEEMRVKLEFQSNNSEG